MTLRDSAYDICQAAVAILREEQVLDREAVLTGVKHVEIDGATVERQANKVERACNRAFDRVRHHVIDSFAWSFLKREVNALSLGLIDGRYRTEYPGEAEVKILGCFGPDGHRVQWSVYHREYILSDDPIARIVYMDDDPDVENYPSLVRNAIIYSLASAIAIEVTGRAADAQMAEAESRTLIQQARTDDARQSGTGTDAYGRNYLFDVATGRIRAKHLGGRAQW